MYNFTGCELIDLKEIHDVKGPRGAYCYYWSKRDDGDLIVEHIEEFASEFYSQYNKSFGLT